MLEYVWMLEEDYGKAENVRIAEKFGDEVAKQYIALMEGKKLINLHGLNVVFTETGKKRAELIIRRHRIAERLLNDVLDMQGDEFEKGACQFEHFVNEEIIASICTLLGHPSICPHGKKIPQGDCCLSAKKNLEPVISPLSTIKAGKTVKVVYISTKSHTSLDRLTGIGVIPGLELTIHQKFPSMILQYGETQLALDNDIAKNVFVRIIND
jgi:DtxR family Mn-dependent transcriptional regulator